MMTELSRRLMSTAIFSVLVLAMAKSQLTIDSDRTVRKEIGSNVSFQCSDHSGVIKAKDIRWNYTLNRDGNFTSRVSNENGTLLIASLVESDSGEYVCTAVKSQQSLKAVLKVFEKPDYTTFATSIISVSGALFLILIVGQIIIIKQKHNNKDL